MISMLWNVDSVYACAALEQGAKALCPDRVGADEAGQPKDEIAIAKHTRKLRFPGLKKDKPRPLKQIAQARCSFRCYIHVILPVGLLYFSWPWLPWPMFGGVLE